MDLLGFQRLRTAVFKAAPTYLVQEAAFLFAQMTTAVRDLRYLRYLEYVQSMQWNLCHPQIHSVHYLLEHKNHVHDLKRMRLDDPCKKLTVTYLGRYMHYNDAMNYGAKHLHNQIVMIMNLDIYLGRGFDAFQTYSIPQSTLVGLSRHERPYPFPGQYSCCSRDSYDGCTDAFLFRSPVKDVVLRQGADKFFFLGRLFFDSRVVQWISNKMCGARRTD